MKITKIFKIIISIMLFFFLMGGGVAYYKANSNSSWNDDGIRGIKDGCRRIGQSTAFCECYTKEITSRISMKEFFELTKRMKTDEAEKSKAKAFVDPIINLCMKNDQMQK